MLRYYQEDAVQDTLDYLDSNKKNPLIVAPCGAGKSHIIAAFADRLDGEVLVFQPSKELLRQNLDKYTAYGFDASIYSASFSSREIGHVTFSTIGTAKSAPEKFNHIKWCIVDECDTVPVKKDTMYRKFFEKNPQMRVIGLTATPIRLVTKIWGSELRMINRQRGGLFSDISHVTQIDELVDKGYLCPLNYTDYSFDSRRLLVNTTGSDYMVKSMEEALDEQKMFIKAKDKISEIYATNKQVLTFCPSIDSSLKMQKELKEDYNVESIVITSKTPAKERKRLLEEYKQGKHLVAINVNVLSVGFDHPSIANIVLLRPTMSYRMYYQQLGRGMRPYEGKKLCNIFDFSGNFRKFGDIQDMRVIDYPKWGWCMTATKRNYLLTNISLNSRKITVNTALARKFGRHSLSKETVPELIEKLYKNETIIVVKTTY